MLYEIFALGAVAGLILALVLVGASLRTEHSYNAQALRKRINMHGERIVWMAIGAAIIEGMRSVIAWSSGY